MDPINVKDLSTTNSLTAKELDRCKANGETRSWPKTPFPIDHEINKRVVLYDGDLELLEADAVVNPTSENLNVNLPAINKLAGPELEVYLKKRIKLCATGDVRLSPGFESKFKNIIHAVPPKYQPKYKTAAETALFHTYFRILETMIEKKIRTVVMPTLVTTKCNLPIEENCHLQLRVIRRFLEKKWNEFDKIVILVNNGELFRVPFFCYFPHASVDEEIACFKFNQSIGGPNGEPVIPEREIRIKSKPAVLSGANDQSIDLTSGLDLSTVVGKTAFSKMQEDLDKTGLPLKTSASNFSANRQLVARKNVFRGCTLL